MKICIVAECEAKAVGRGLCMKHFKRVSRTGSTDAKPRRRTCETEGCKNKHAANGLCGTCRNRKRKSEGLCYRCGKVKTDKAYCDACRVRVNENKRNNRARKKSTV